jgi:TolB-like protein
MESESPKPTTTPTAAVFLSYASQDAEAAARVCNALRAAGIEVWFDRSELRGGDAWDQSIRKQIKTCALFIPVISQHTHERAEGYFRLEWKLAVDRCQLMSADKPFLVPVVIDDTPDDDQRVPDKFREVQWTRLARGEARPDFATRIGQLLTGESDQSLIRARPQPVVSRRTSRSGRWLTLVVVLGAIAAYILVERPWIAKSTLPVRQTAPAETSAAFSPPPHSIAVLPFVNLSGDASQDYFSDGLTEELLNSLAEINELQVAARTSSFSFKEHPDIASVARKLNVGAVLEGSVRRSANTVRVTVQLINAATGFHLWSKTYDRDLGDVLKLQTEIATAVASTLKVTLLGDVSERIELGGTRNPRALDAYLRASKPFLAYQREADLQAAIADYSEAIRHDPSYALALAYRSLALAAHARNYATGPAIHEGYAKAQADSLNAISLAPELAEAHLSLACILRDSLEFARAAQEFQRAVSLGPGNAHLLGEYGVFAAETGQTEAGIAATRHAVVLDPLSSDAHTSLGYALMTARRYGEAAAAFTDAKGLARGPGFANAWLGFAYYASGDFQSARAACDGADESNRPICFALVYEKLGRHVEARQTLSRLQAETGDASAVFYASIYAQWGDTTRALGWLETAMRHRDPYLIRVRAGHLLDPLRNEPRFQAIERELKFPN